MSTSLPAPTVEQLQNDPESVKFQTAPYDSRFPNINQTKNCWQNYVDFHKCIRAKGEDYEPCGKFKRRYRILCPDQWIEKWDEWLTEGRNPFNMDPPKEQ